MTTFVLVHGAVVGGWCWRWVAAELRGDGHDVHTPTLTGLGERVHLASRHVDLDTHIEDVVNLLYYAHLVYLDSEVPRDGETSGPPGRLASHSAVLTTARRGIKPLG